MVPTTGTVTQRAAKGIPPRVCSPPRAKHKPAPKQAGKNLKRHASESDDDEREHPDSDDSRPREKEKRHGKRQHTEESEEEEIIDEEVEAERFPEEVKDIQDEQSGDEVSRLQSPLTWCTHEILA